MKEVREKPELSAHLSVDPAGNLVGVDHLHRHEKSNHSAEHKVLFSRLARLGLWFTVFTGLGIAVVFYLERAGHLGAVTTGAILLFFVFVMPILFLGYVCQKVLAPPK
jgi:lipopolysaccharide export LptBFGC system permease protein LptF